MYMSISIVSMKLLYCMLHRI